MKVESATAEPEQRDPHLGAFVNPPKWLVAFTPTPILC